MSKLLSLPSVLAQKFWLYPEFVHDGLVDVHAGHWFVVELQRALDLIVDHVLEAPCVSMMMDRVERSPA